MKEEEEEEEAAVKDADEEDSSSSSSSNNKKISSSANKKSKQIKEERVQSDSESDDSEDEDSEYDSDGEDTSDTAALNPKEGDRSPQNKCLAALLAPWNLFNRLCCCWLRCFCRGCKSCFCQQMCSKKWKRKTRQGAILILIQISFVLLALLTFVLVASAYFVQGPLLTGISVGNYLTGIFLSRDIYTNTTMTKLNKKPEIEMAIKVYQGLWIAAKVFSAVTFVAALINFARLLNYASKKLGMVIVSLFIALLALASFIVIVTANNSANLTDALESVSNSTVPGADQNSTSAPTQKPSSGNNNSNDDEDSDADPPQVGSGVPPVQPQEPTPPAKPPILPGPPADPPVAQAPQNAINTGINAVDVAINAATDYVKSAYETMTHYIGAFTLSGMVAILSVVNLVR